VTDPTTTSDEHRPPLPSAEGQHDITSYVCVFMALLRDRQSGMLEVSNRRGWRRLHFLEGQVVAFSSSFVQDALGRTLATAGLLPKSRIQWIEEKLGPGEQLETALQLSGALTPEQLEEHQQGRIRQGIAAPLRVSSGAWRFEPAAGLQPEHLASEFRPVTGSAPALWEGVKQHVAVDKVLPTVTEDGRGDLQLGDDFTTIFPQFELEPPLTFLGEAIGDAISVEALFKQIPDRSGNLLKLVWLLECGGLLHREGERAVDTTAASIQKACTEAQRDSCVAQQLAWARALHSGEPYAPSVAAPSAEQGAPAHSPALAHTPGAAASPRLGDDQESVASVAADGRSVSRRGGTSAMTPARLAVEHGKRLKRDFYGFLGLKPGAPVDVVDRRCKRLVQRWRQAEEMPGHTETSNAQLQQLLHGLQIVWQTLTSPSRKEEYDRRLNKGQAPMVNQIQRALESAEPGSVSDETEPDEEMMGSGDLDYAIQLMRRGRHAAASQILERMRRDNPSSPDVLAELGWAVWKARGDAADSGPEDFVALALTFDPQHTRALEVHARIASERGETEQAQLRIERLLATDPHNEWGMAATGRGSPSTPSDTRSAGSSLRFWRRRS